MLWVNFRFELLIYIFTCSLILEVKHRRRYRPCESCDFARSNCLLIYKKMIKKIVKIGTFT